MNKIECMDMMENLGYIDLIDHSNNICEPGNLSDFQHSYVNNSTRVNNDNLVREEPRSLDELGFMFLDWLKSNQPKRSTVGSDFNLLGSTTEGKKRLLKLILEWASCEFPFRYEETSQNTSPSRNIVSESISPNPKLAESISPNPKLAGIMAQTWPESGRYPTNNSNDYIIDNNFYDKNNNNNNHYSSSSNFPSGQGCAEYGDQVPYQYYNGSGADNLVNLGLWGTKVPRKKRMARRNRFLSQHCHHHSNSQNQSVDKQGRCGNENGVAVGKGTPALADGRQGWKSETKLRFLLQKVLTRSDVGDMGRIVLPKKEAETHFPTLGSRSGIPIEMKDIGRSRVWNMHYRFWPNNKSRMYILENTGNFVRANGLREGDTILIYTDIKSNKYFIRGVKVQHPKKGSKSQTLHQEACIEP